VRANPIRGRERITGQVESDRRSDVNLRKLGGIGAVMVAVFTAGLWAAVGSAGWLSAEANAIGVRATLAAAKEIPKPAGVGRNATGRFTGGLTRRAKAGTLAWRLTFSGLTGRATAAHIHLARPGVAGPVAVPLCGPCRSGARGTARLNERTVTALLGGRAYVNVHTARNPAGEIRGQIQKGGTALPSPTNPTTTSPPTTEPPPYPTDPYP
jgi:CHRD domain